MTAEIPGIFDEDTYTSDLTYFRKENPDVFNALPERFLENYKSFCWHNKTNDAQLLCLPRAYLGGVIKCGSSEIHEKLLMHPELSRGKTKEHKWWSRYRIQRPWRELSPDFKKKPFSNYLRDLLPQTVTEDTVLFDGSATLIWHQLFWEERYPFLEERPYSNADMIRSITPDAKILVIVRNPTERLWSGYLFFHRNFPGSPNVSPMTFDDAVRKEIVRFRDCVKGKGLRRCCFDSKHLNRYDTAVVTLTLGIYICYIREWKEKFGDHMKIIRLEDYGSRPSSTLHEVYEFLEVSPFSEEKIDAFINIHEAKETRNSNNRVLGDMLNSTRQLLNSFYRPFNLELAKLLNDNRFLYDSLIYRNH